MSCLPMASNRGPGETYSCGENYDALWAGIIGELESQAGNDWKLAEYVHGEPCKRSKEKSDVFPCQLKVAGKHDNTPVRRDHFDQFKLYQAAAVTAALKWRKTSKTTFDVFKTTIRHLCGLFSNCNIKWSRTFAGKGQATQQYPLHRAFNTHNRMTGFWFILDDARILNE